MSTQECKIALCSRNQHKMKPIPPHLLHSYPVFHRIQYKWLDLLEESTEIPWDTCLKSIWILISVQQIEESSLHPISSQYESWFPVLDWRFEPNFHQHLKWSFPSAIVMWEGPCVFCLKWNEPRETLTKKKAGFPCSGLNSGSCFISQDEGMSESCVEILEETLVPRFICTGGLTSLDTSRGSWSSRLQKLMRLDSSWKWIGIPISLWKLERDPWSPTSPPEVSVLSCQA